MTVSVSSVVIPTHHKLGLISVLFFRQETFDFEVTFFVRSPTGAENSDNKESPRDSLHVAVTMFPNIPKS